MAMDNETRDFLTDLEEAMDQALLGKPSRHIRFSEEIGNPELKRLADKAARLFSDVHEASKMADELARGRLGGFCPSHGNMLAGPLRRMQAQFSAFTRDIDAFLCGRGAPKMQEDGELFRAVNELISRMADTSAGGAAWDTGVFTTTDTDREINVTDSGWRHQILAAANEPTLMVIGVDEFGTVVYANLPGKALLAGREHLRPGAVQKEEDFLLAYLCDLHVGKPDYPVLAQVSNAAADQWHRVASDSFSLPNGQRLFLHMADDITDWKLCEERLEPDVDVDPLTGMLNRRAGLGVLKTLQTNASGVKHCVAFISIDNLKRVNDTYGHNEGDEYIRTVADVLKNCEQPAEIAIRYGGDEFFLVFRDCELAAAKRALLHMRKKMDTIKKESGKPYKMSFSYGVNIFGGNFKQPLEDMPDSVDAHMYINKTGK